MKQGSGCIEQLIIDEGFTSIPNIILRYSKELELDYSDIGILSVLTYIKQNNSIANENNINTIGFPQDLLKRGERLNLIEITSIDTVDFTFQPLVERLRLCLKGHNGINLPDDSAENRQTTEFMMTKMQKDLCEKDQQIRELEQKIKLSDGPPGANAEHDNPLSEIFAFMQQSLGRLVNRTEAEAISEWINSYGFEIETVLIMLQEMYGREKTHINYLETVAMDWHKQGVRSKDDALKLIQAQKAKTGLNGRIGRYISLKHHLTVPEMQIVGKWISEYGFSEEIILKACDQTVGSREPSIGYIDTILSDWSSKGFNNMEMIDEYIKNNKLNRKTAGAAPSTQKHAANQTKDKDWEDFREYEEFSKRQGYRKTKA